MEWVLHDGKWVDGINADIWPSDSFVRNAKISPQSLDKRGWRRVEHYVSLQVSAQAARWYGDRAAEADKGLEDRIDYESERLKIIRGIANHRKRVWFAMVVRVLDGLKGLRWLPRNDLRAARWCLKR